MTATSVQMTFVDNETTTALEAILPLTEESERIDVGMAFLSWAGWKRLRDALTAFVDRGGRLRVVLRRDRWRTSVYAVSALLELHNTEVRFHPDPYFHAKRINFHCGEKLAVLVGSANLTVGGLETNPEDGVILELDADSPEARQARRTFETWWRASTPVTEVELRRLKAERGLKRPTGAAPRQPRRGASRTARSALQEGEKRSTADPARQRQADLRAARRLFELARATQDADERRRLVEVAEGLLAQGHE